MVESKRESWHRIIKRIQDVGVDGFELNFGCPHGMSERGMGSAVGQVPEYAEKICRWVKEVSTRSGAGQTDAERRPSIREIGRAVKRGGADGDQPHQHDQFDHGSGPEMLRAQAERRRIRLARRILRAGRQTHRAATWSAKSPAIRRFDLPISGIGGIRKWEDAVEFMLLGATTRAGLHGGDAPRVWHHQGDDPRAGEMDGRKGIRDRSARSVGQAMPRIKHWGELDLNYKVVAQINETTCIHCGICYASCEDGCYQAIDWDKMSSARLHRQIRRAPATQRRGGAEPAN